MPSKKGKHHPVGVAMKPSKSEFGSFIRTQRLKLNLRQAPLSELIGVGGNNISMIEIGKRKYLNDDQLKKLAGVFKCDVEDLRKRMPVKYKIQPNTELGKLIRSRRKELGLSLSVFSKKLKMTLQQARNLEVRKNPSLRYNLVKPLAIVLKINPSVLGKFAGTNRKETKSELGQLVRTRRIELGMSIVDLAQKLDVSRQLVSQIELGQCRLSKNDDMIARLARSLKLGIDKLEAVRPERIRKQIENPTSLGEFLAMKRSRLRLTQAEVGERIDVVASTVSSLETGRLPASVNILDKLSKALDCKIPRKFIPVPKKRGRPRGSGKHHHLHKDEEIVEPELPF